MNIPISAFPNFQSDVPEGDNRTRMVCADCEWIHYENPRIILSALCLWDDRVLLCRRAIAPRYGFWTLPGGFMELGETTHEGTCREVAEEACAEIDIVSLLGTYAIPRIGQVHLVYLANLTSEKFAAGSESLDVQLFPVQHAALPWEDLAFPVNHWTLRDYLSLAGSPPIQPFGIREEDRDQRMSSVEFHPDFRPPGTDEAPVGRRSSG